MAFKFKSKVVLWPGETANWHFAYLPIKLGKEVKEKYGKKQRGWSSLPVIVKLGKTSWKTSIFFDRRSNTYILPLKAEIRKKEFLHDGDIATFSIQIKV